MTDLERPICLEDEVTAAEGIDTDDSGEVERIERLESLMSTGANLISTVLECQVPGCNREISVLTPAGRFHKDSAIDLGTCALRQSPDTSA